MFFESRRSAKPWLALVLAGRFNVGELDLSFDFAIDFDGVDFFFISADGLNQVISRAGVAIHHRQSHSLQN